MSQPINETNGGVKVQHNTKKGFNAAAKDQVRQNSTDRQIDTSHTDENKRNSEPRTHINELTLFLSLLSLSLKAS